MDPNYPHQEKIRNAFIVYDQPIQMRTADGKPLEFTCRIIESKSQFQEKGYNFIYVLGSLSTYSNNVATIYPFLAAYLDARANDPSLPPARFILISQYAMKSEGAPFRSRSLDEAGLILKNVMETLSEKVGPIDQVVSQSLGSIIFASSLKHFEPNSEAAPQCIHLDRAPSSIAAASSHYFGGSLLHLFASLSGWSLDIGKELGDFARFLETMSFSHASVLNASNISRECQFPRKTVDSYLLILQHLLLSFQLQVFHRKAKRTLSHQPKFYYFDSGVYSSLRPQNLYDVVTEKEGPALEGLVAQHLKAWVDAQSTPHQLHFWRTASKVEVDFVVSGPSCFCAIEVKNGTNVHPSDLRGLEAFREDYPEAKPILLYRGKYRLKEKEILCIPIEEYLRKINPGLPLPDYSRLNFE